MVSIVKTPEVLKNETKRVIGRFFREESRLKTVATLLEEVALKLAALGILSKINASYRKKDAKELISDIKNNKEIKSNLLLDPERDDSNIETAKKNFNENGFNFMNNWSVEFIHPNLDSDSINLLQDYVSEFTEPSYEIITNDINISIRKYTDIVDIIAKEFTLSFYVDSFMYVPKIFIELLNKIKNFKTGLLGYKKKYEFSKITVFINNNVGLNIMRYEFYNCILKSVGDNAFTHDKSDVKKYTVTFDYGYHEIYGHSDFLITQ